MRLQIYKVTAAKRNKQKGKNPRKAHGEGEKKEMGRVETNADKKPDGKD